MFLFLSSRYNGGDEMDQRVADEYTVASHEMEFTQVLIAAVQDGKPLSRTRPNGGSSRQ